MNLARTCHKGIGRRRGLSGRDFSDIAHLRREGYAACICPGSQGNRRHALCCASLPSWTEEWDRRSERTRLHRDDARSGHGFRLADAQSHPRSKLRDLLIFFGYSTKHPQCKSDGHRAQSSSWHAARYITRHRAHPVTICSAEDADGLPFHACDLLTFSTAVCLFLLAESNPSCALFFFCLNVDRPWCVHTSDYRR